jgi:hypothetical protein
MSPVPRPIARLVLVEAAAASVIALLAPPCHASAVLDVARSPDASLERVATPLAWWLAALVTAWLVATTIVGVAARAWPRWSRLRRVEWLGAATITRYVDAAFVLAVSLGTITASAGVAAAAPSGSTASAGAPVTVEVQPDGTLVLVPPKHAPTATTSTTRPPSPPPVAPRAPAAPAPSPREPAPELAAPSIFNGDASLTVAAGDNLWRIASAHLAVGRGRVVHDDEIVPYWRAVVAANRTTLRSGDPNLIFPGEIVTLPALPPAE